MNGGWGAGSHGRHLGRKAAWKLFREFISPATFQELFAAPPPLRLVVEQQLGSLADRAIKLKLKTDDGQSIECVVLLPTGKPGHPTRRATACVSSQIGCAVGCPFCATGMMGWKGNLNADQIWEQVYWAGLLAAQSGRRLRNVVFMGMGEPLHNRQHVLAAIERLLDGRRGFGLAPRHITLSTVGVPRGMIELAQRFPGVRQAVSLHAAIPEMRRRLVPKAVGDLETLRETIAQINRLQDQATVWLEMVLLEGINDDDHHVDALIAFCAGLRVSVNLIPYNTLPGHELWQPTPQPRREAIANRLRSAGIRTTIRTSFGRDLQAACGQLSGLHAASSPPSASARPAHTLPWLP